MENRGICGVTHNLFHLDIFRHLDLEVVARVADLRNSFFPGKDLLSGEVTSVLEDTINVHVAALPVVARGPIFAELLCREGSVSEDVVEDGACLRGGHVQLVGRHEVADNIALLEGQSVIFAVLVGGRDA